MVCLGRDLRPVFELTVQREGKAREAENKAGCAGAHDAVRGRKEGRLGVRGGCAEFGVCAVKEE
ncbi:hypothetical protein B0H17DRAFT_1073486, partial [Mycena rosella]